MSLNTELPPAGSNNDSDEIDLLELLVVVVENIKLLVIGSIVVGLIALGTSYVVKPSYESVSVLRLGKVSSDLVVGLARSADVLQAVAKDMDIAPDASHTARLELMRSKVKAVVGRQDNMITLTTQATTPERAYKLNQVVWQHIYPLTQPLAIDAQRVQAQIETLQEDLKTGAALAKSTAKLLEVGNIRDGADRLYVDVRSANMQRALDIAKLQGELGGLSNDNLVQQATQPDQPVRPKKTLVAVVAALAAGVVLLIFVFMRQALRSAQGNPRRADILRRLRAAWGFKQISQKTRTESMGVFEKP